MDFSPWARCREGAKRVHANDPATGRHQPRRARCSCMFRRYCRRITPPQLQHSRCLERHQHHSAVFDQSSTFLLSSQTRHQPTPLHSSTNANEQAEQWLAPFPLPFPFLFPTLQAAGNPLALPSRHWGKKLLYGQQAGQRETGTLPAPDTSRCRPGPSRFSSRLGPRLTQLYIVLYSKPFDLIPVPLWLDPCHRQLLSRERSTTAIIVSLCRVRLSVTPSPVAWTRAVFRHYTGDKAGPLILRHVGRSVEAVESAGPSALFHRLRVSYRLRA